MEFTRSDLLKLLTLMEGELQAREVAIAVLKSEQAKQLLYPVGGKDVNKVCRLLKSSNTTPSKASAGTATMIPNKKTPLSLKSLTQSPSSFACGSASDVSADPFAALARDGTFAFDPNFDDTSSKALFNIQLRQLYQMIEKHKESRQQLVEQLDSANEKYNAIFQEFEVEKSKAERYERETALSQIEQLEKENESLKETIKNLKGLLEAERDREKKMILCLLAERKTLIVKLIEEKQRNNELMQVISSNKTRIGEMIEGLEEESKRSLQMELELEKLQTDFKKERQSLVDRLHLTESKNNQMEHEIEKLRRELEVIKPGSSAAIPSTSVQRSGIANEIGEGVRSSIVTVASSGAHRIVPNVSSVMPVNSPKANIASPISKSVLVTTSSVTPSPASNQIPGSKQTYNTIKASPKMALVNHAYSLPDSSEVKTGASTASSNDEPPPSLPLTQPPSKLPESIGVPYQPQLRSLHDSLTASKSIDVAGMNVSKAPLLKRLSGSGSTRGTPPPVPPNKPVLPAQILKERSKLIQASVSKPSQPASPASLGAEGETHRPGASNHDSKLSTVLVKSTSNNNETVIDVDQSNVDLICQELADFQKLLVSMVNNKSSMTHS